MFHATKRLTISALLIGTMATGTGGLLFAAPAHAAHGHPAAARHARVQRLAHRLLLARRAGQVWTVTSVSGPIIAARARNGITFTITTTSTTTFKEAGSTVALSAVQANEHIRVLGTRNQAAKTIQATSVVIVLPNVTGVVTAVNGSTLTLTGRNAVRYTINLGSAKIEQAGQAATAQAITVGSLLTAQGPMGADGTFTALRVVIRLPQFAGTIAAVNGMSFTLRTAQGKTFSITPASTAVYVTGKRGAAPTTATTAPTFTVGEHVRVQGSLSADGTTLTALRIRIAPSAAQPVPAGTSTSGA
ncbi:MAG TPA: DUF5666 domain-containing protein [Chloroflexota bacterium]|nr:DUF5666 domain-containing protein [Chloroflexota bacterium]